jgi:hypothetical protein
MTAELSSHLLTRVRMQLGLLTAQFLLGMGVNLIGEPEGGLALASKNLLLASHIIVAIGLFIGVGLTMRLAIKQGGRILLQTRGAGAAVGLAILAGGLTMFVDSDWWSFVMAIAFIVAFVVYGLLYVRLRTNS